jgi:uncharacterized protein YceH (UPF0502 family)
MDQTLTEVDVRVLGSLIEKEITTPDNYPLSLNALTAACNQLSNREPVMELDEPTVKAGVDRLRRYALVRSIQRADSRVMKYMHLFGDAMSLDRPAVAVMCVLMLRGPQTIGELRTRTTRLHDFQSLEEVEATLGSLASRQPSPLLVRLERQPGQKEARYAHLLSGEPTYEAPHAATTPAEPDEPATDRVAALEAAVENLRREVVDLRSELAEFRRQFD